MTDFVELKQEELNCVNGGIPKWVDELVKITRVLDYLKEAYEGFIEGIKDNYSKYQETFNLQ
jgi:hypothetical protein